jgi:hypothetical protein
MVVMYALQTVIKTMFKIKLSVFLALQPIVVVFSTAL